MTTSSFCARPVTVSVSGGDEKGKARLFYVYPDVLRSSSEYFRKLITVDGHKHEQRIEVNQTYADTFGLYLHFLYFGKVPCRAHDNDPGKSTEYDELFHLYIFADSVKDVKVKNAVIGAIMSKSVEKSPAPLPDKEVITLAYDDLTYGSPLQRLVVDLYTWFADESCLDQGWDSMQSDFALDLARALLKRNGATRKQRAIPAGVGICDYHDPGDCAECVNKKRKRAE